MKQFFQRMCLHLKSMGLLVLVPVVVLDFLYPTLIFLAYRNVGFNEYLMMSIKDISYTYLPFFSVWYVIFSLHEYVESDGNELLYVSKRKVRLTDAAILFVLYMSNVALYLVVFSFAFKAIWMFGLMLLCVCFMYLGMTYLLLFASGSLTLTLMGLLIYTLVAVIGSTNVQNFMLYVTPYSDVQALISMSLPQVVVGGACCLLGVWMNQRYKKFR